MLWGQELNKGIFLKGKDRAHRMIANTYSENGKVLENFLTFCGSKYNKQKQDKTSELKLVRDSWTSDESIYPKGWKYKKESGGFKIRLLSPKAQVFPSIRIALVEMSKKSYSTTQSDLKIIRKALTTVGWDFDPKLVQLYLVECANAGLDIVDVGALQAGRSSVDARPRHWHDVGAWVDRRRRRGRRPARPT